jgi:hypothetical protein
MASGQLVISLKKPGLQITKSELNRILCAEKCRFVYDETTPPDEGCRNRCGHWPGVGSYAEPIGRDGKAGGRVAVGQVLTVVPVGVAWRRSAG